MSSEIAAYTPLTLLQQAIVNKVDMAQLKELMELHERWEKKEARKAFFEALSKFQSVVPILNKNKTANVTSRNGGGSFSYKYADLGSITNQIKDALTDCGLSYRWEFQETGGNMKVTCLVSHFAGHTEQTSMEAAKDDSGAKNAIQQKGSTQTYLQRYTLIGALGLSTADQDNDGKSHSKRQQQDDDLSLDHWKQAVNDIKAVPGLTGLYLKNKAVVDANPDIKKIFKDREAQLKKAGSDSKSPVNQMA